ncbi:MAG TPA: 3-dehydroquinate synthase, partial [Xanthomonadales bacterium]|nr:3-dehydroquinate synthase [Xanthomonadales bacterium]
GDEWPRWIRGAHVLLVSDDCVAPLYAAPVRAALRGRSVAELVLPAGEASKTLANGERAFAALAQAGASRDACVVALGGGVVGDLAGFVAACWMRGVDFVQLPTTLLAMVDSSVGGKTAVNLAQGKNLVGAFHQPRGVAIDVDVLRTLPPRELAAGWAEVVKYGAIRDDAFFGWLDAHADALVAGDVALRADAIGRSVAHKAEVVAADEREQGERALLNFGHTFAHAIETVGDYASLHGEAVAIGMVLAARLSARLGLAPATDASALQRLLVRFALPVELDGKLAPEALLEAMRLDKKAASGKLRLVLWRGIGKAFVTGDVRDADILAELRGRR